MRIKRQAIFLKREQDVYKLEPFQKVISKKSNFYKFESLEIKLYGL